jgi:single-strand DNA-binding protein
MLTSNNIVQLNGYLGKDPEVVQHHRGKLVKITLITEESYKNGKGELIRKFQSHPLCAWGEEAEKAEKLLKKGVQVYVTGKLNHNTFTDRNGTQRQVTEVRVEDIKILG